MLDKLNSYVEQGLLKRQVSPCGKLVLYDYTEKCQFEKAWDEVTLNHRGTVYELETGRIVARAFPKFFNFSELDSTAQAYLLTTDTFSVYEKLDGSLGIIYFYDGEWRVNTRGSFTSDQAIKGLELLHKLEHSKLSTLNTYLVEIIYPENRIVVDYNGWEGLVHLATIETETGKEFPLPKVHEYMLFNAESAIERFNSISEVLAKLKTLSFNEEGYVVQFYNGQRAKFKGDEYVEMHRLISGLSPLTIWERMEKGKVSKEFLATIPEEFRDRYEDIAYQLENKYTNIEDAVRARVMEVAKATKVYDDLVPETRKTLGLYLKDNDHEFNQFMFPVFLKKHDLVSELIKKYIRPTGNQI